MTPQTGGGRTHPPAPPSSPAVSQRNGHPPQQNQYHQQAQLQHPLSQQQIANLLQFAQSSYTTNPTDALSALMDALTLSTGTNSAALHAMDRIRSELGHVVADCIVAGSSMGSSKSSSANRTTTNQQESDYNQLQQQQQQQQQQYQPHTSPLSSQLSTREMTTRAMAIVQEMLNDTSTILYAQGRQNLLQQAMEDGSSIVCSNCGDMISRERWRQHADYWCRGIVLVTEEEQHEEDDEKSGTYGMEL